MMTTATARAPLTHPHRIDYRDGVPEGASALEARITRLWLHLVCDHGDDTADLAYNGNTGDTEADLGDLVDLHQELHERHDRYLDVVDAARRVVDVLWDRRAVVPAVRDEAVDKLRQALVQFDVRRADQNADDA